MLSLPPTSKALHRLESANSRDRIALGSFDSRSVYHATSLGKRGRGIVNAIESADVTSDGSELTQQVENEGYEDDFDYISTCLASDRCHCTSSIQV